VLHGVCYALEHRLLVHVERLCHGLPPSALLRLALLGVVPLPLGLTPRLFHLRLLLPLREVLGPYRTIWVARAADNPVAGEPLGHLDLLPALGTQTAFPFLWPAQPGQEGAGAAPQRL